MKGTDMIENLKVNLIITAIIILSMIIIPILNANKVVTTNKDENKVVNINDNNIIKNISLEGSDKITVFISKENKIKEMSVDDYLYGVISSEMSPTFDIEALKAQAIAARTFVLNKKKYNCKEANGAYICDTIHCQVYRDKDRVIESWSEDKKNEYWGKIKEAVESTSGLVITYQDEIIKYPQFFSTSSGKTENCRDVFSSDVPYLVSKESTGEEISPSFKSTTEILITDFIDKINSKYPEAKLTKSNIANDINIVSRSEAGGVINIKLGGATVKGTEFRMLLGLKSTNFIYRFDGNKIVFDCVGYGHGVGMSQWGANVMAKNGSKYNEIIKYYYTGVDISKVTFEN